MLEFDLSTNYKGEGISEGLERGILVFFTGQNLVQEGMGLGTVALRTRNLTYFSKKSRLRKISANEYVKEFYIDTAMTWKIFNKRSIILTKLLEEFGNFYKKEGVATQELLLNIGIWLRRILGIKSEMTKYRSLGKVNLNYKLLENEVLITVDFSQVLNNNPENLKLLCILNELGGDFFNKSRISKLILPAPSGWNQIKDPQSLKRIKLYSDRLKLEFGIEILRNVPNFKIDYFFGRENVANYCWAGFVMEIDLESIDYKSEDCLIEYICKFDVE
jgi:hypothetical protein